MNDKTPPIDRWLQSAISYQRTGDIEAAQRLYERILGCDPQNADALHLLGIIDFGRGDFARAIFNIQSAVDADPSFANFHRSLGNVKRRMGSLEEALHDYQKALAINSRDVAALAACGAIHYQLARMDAAESCYRQCIQINPDIADVYNNLGLVYRADKRYQAAISCFQRAVSIDSRLLSARCSLAVTLKDQGRLAAAMEELQKTLAIDPAYADAYYNLALVQTQMGRSFEALASYTKAIALKPDFAPSYNNMGILLQELGRTRQALTCFQKAIQMDPTNAKAHYNLGVLHKYHAHYSEALACLKKALDIDPDFSLARKALTTHMRDVCLWPAAALSDVRHGPVKPTEPGPDVLEPIGFMFEELARDYLDDVLAGAKQRSRQIEQRTSFVSTPFRQNHHGDTGGKIIAGYISNNFRDHPTAHLIVDLLAGHDRNRFEVFCFSYGENDDSVYRKKIESACDRFIDLYHLSSSEAASVINRAKTHILIDLNGYTACSRPDICSFRPAPLQVRYLGEPKTSGASFFDYLIGDHIVTPTDHQALYHESLVLMPHSYQVNSRHLVDEKPVEFERQNVDLPNDSFVFCSFSSSYKIDPTLFEAWAHILDRVPDSVLWLLKRDVATESNLKLAAERLGIDPGRLIFTEAFPKAAHLSRLRLADVALDTRVVNGAATTSDALWSGVPVVTLRGDHFASRMSASILTAVGLPELITADLREYEELAVSLAVDPAKLDHIRRKLERNKHSEPLFDTGRFVRNLENAFEQMWAIYLAGEKPRHIYVQDCGSPPIR